MGPAAVLSIMIKAQGAQAAIGQLNGVNAAAKKAGDGVDTLEKKSAKGRAAFDKVGKGAGIVAGGVALIGAAAVNSAAKYEQSMNTLQAVSGSTGAEMKKISKLAIKLGADVRLPGTSAQDAAEAMTEMIKAGVSLKDTMAGVRSTLVLSAAASISNAEAAEIASNALNAFKLEGKDVQMVTDQLANTANASSVEIRDVADSFKMAAAVFSGFQAPTLGAKKAMTELNVAIGILGNAGIKGSDAGTSLKQMLLQLTGPSNKAKEAMLALFFAAKGNAGAESELTTVLQGSGKERAKALEQLTKLNPALKNSGDIAFDQAGKMRSLKDIIALVAAGTRKMTDEQKAAYVTQIFGADATRSVIALMNAGPAAFDKMTAAVTKQGSAQALADAKMKGFKGSMEALKSTLETLAINVGTKLLPVLTALVKQLSSVASALSPTAWLVLIGVIGTLSVAVFGINAAFRVYEAGVIAVTAAQWLFNAALTANPIGIVIVSVTALGAALVIAYKKSETFRNIVNATGSALKTIFVGAISLVLGALSKFLGGVGAVARAVGADGLANKAKQGQAAIDDLRNSLNNIPAKKNVEVGVTITLDGQSVDVSKAKPLSPTPPGGDGPGVIGSKIGDLVRKSRKVQAGVKSAVSGGLGSASFGGGGGGGGGLDGAKPALRPFAAAGAKFGLHVSAGKNHHSKFVSGTNRVSNHFLGNAIDLANGRGPDDQKMAAAKYIAARWGANLDELIYTPLGWSIKGGQKVAAYARADHYDHVHVAIGGGTGDGSGVGDGQGRLSGVNLAIDAARRAGFKGTDLVNMIAIAGRESGYNPRATNFKPPDHSIGLWQINQLAHHGRFGTDAQLMDPYTNAKAAYALSGGGHTLSPWAHAGGPLGGTNVAAARKAVLAFKGGTSTGGAGNSAGSAGSGAGGGTAAARVNPFDQKIANADLAIQQAAGQGTAVFAGGRKVGPAMAKIAAATAKRKLIGARIRSIRKALKGKLSPAKRLALTQELTQRLSEHSQLGTDIAGLRNPATTDTGGSIGGDIGGTAGDGSDPNQPLIDAQNAAAEAAQNLADAMAEHQQAVDSLKAEIAAQTALAKSSIGTQNTQAWKALADIMSGQIGGYGGVAGRAMTAGAGTVVRY